MAEAVCVCKEIGGYRGSPPPDQATCFAETKERFLEFLTLKPIVKQLLRAVVTQCFFGMAFRLSTTGWGLSLVELHLYVMLHDSFWLCRTLRDPYTPLVMQ